MVFLLRRKQLKREVSEQYPLISEEDLDTVLPSKAGLHCVKYESGKNGSVSVYYVIDNNPIFFVHNGRLFPTGKPNAGQGLSGMAMEVTCMYTCSFVKWDYFFIYMYTCICTFLNMYSVHLVESPSTRQMCCNQCLRCEETNGWSWCVLLITVMCIINYAKIFLDLMLPGVCTEKDGGFSLSGITVGQPLAVNIVGNRYCNIVYSTTQCCYIYIVDVHACSKIPTAQNLPLNYCVCRCAVAVGVSLVSSEQIVSSRMRGKALEVLHIYGDHLW